MLLKTSEEDGRRGRLANEGQKKNEKKKKKKKERDR